MTPNHADTAEAHALRDQIDATETRIAHCSRDEIFNGIQLILLNQLTMLKAMLLLLEDPVTKH